MDPVLLIFSAVALFVIWRLISVLGTRTGHEPRRDLEGVQRSTKAAEARAEAAGPAPAGEKPAPVSAAAAPLKAVDPAFDEKAFLDGARVAYEMIVEAFAAGDLKSIRRFLSQSVYDAFKSAVSEREARGHVAELKFVGVDNASIVKSNADGEQMTAVADFASNQVRVTRDKDGKVVDGDPARIDLVKDRWTFARKIANADPNWVLVATGGAS
ncbi:MAG: Tim44/TimA family putative adaptor protein [Parvularculaceae bacterium]